MALLAVFADNNLVCRHILVHEDLDVAILINLRGQIVRSVFMVCLLSRAINLHRVTKFCRMGSIVTGKGQAFVRQAGLCSFQLCHVDGIGIFCTSSHAVDLAGHTAVCLADGYSSIGSIPGGSSFRCTRRIIAGNTSCSRGFGATADGHAAFCTDFCIVANGYNIRSGCCIYSISGAQNNIVLGIRQGVIVAKDDVGLVLVGAVTGYGIVSPDQVVILAIFQNGIETFNIVQLSRIVTILSTVALNRVADTGDLGHISIVNGVAAAHDHDLTTAGRNGFLQILSHSCRTFLLDILLNLAQKLQGIRGIRGIRGTNTTVRIGDCIACTIDDGSIRINRRIGLTNDAVSYATDCLRSISILIDVERTIRQCRCTAKVIDRYIPIIDDTGIGTGYGGSNTISMSIKAGS